MAPGGSASRACGGPAPRRPAPRSPSPRSKWTTTRESTTWSRKRPIPSTDQRGRWVLRPGERARSILLVPLPLAAPLLLPGDELASHLLIAYSPPATNHVADNGHIVGAMRADAAPHRGLLRIGSTRGFPEPRMSFGIHLSLPPWRGRRNTFHELSVSPQLALELPFSCSNQS